jgi:ferredoxin
MKIRLDRSLCQGHARCAAKAPALFPLDADGYSVAFDVDVPTGQETLALAGARNCPEAALRVLDEAGNPLWPPA